MSFQTVVQPLIPQDGASSRSSPHQQTGIPDFAHLFNDLPQELGCYTIGYASSQSVLMYRSLLLTSKWFNRIVHDHADLTGLPILLKSNVHVDSFLYMLHHRPNVGYKIHHVWLLPLGYDGLANQGWSSFHSRRSILPQVISLLPNLRSLACDMNTLSRFTGPGDLPHLKWLTLSYTFITPKTIDILQRVECLHLAAPVGMYDFLREAKLPNIRTMIIPFRNKLWFKGECEVVRTACPNLERVGLLPIEPIRRSIGLDATLREVGPVFRLLNLGFGITDEHVFAESVHDREYVWSLAGSSAAQRESE
jgi:hypothetical protein